MPDYIFNTTALSNFAAANRVELLKAEYQHIAFTTTEICDELRKGLKMGYDYLRHALDQIAAIHPDGWIRVLYPNSAYEYDLRSEYDHVLDLGETSCLSLAVSRRLIFVTDDLAARQSALKENVSITGTIGILVKIVRRVAYPLMRQTLC